MSVCVCIAPKCCIIQSCVAVVGEMKPTHCIHWWEAAIATKGNDSQHEAKTQVENRVAHMFLWEILILYAGEEREREMGDRMNEGELVARICSSLAGSTKLCSMSKIAKLHW